MMVDIDELLAKPYWIVDILPKQVPADAGGQYFTIEKYFMSSPHVDAIYHKFANVVVKLNCYDDILVFRVEDEMWHENPAPGDLVQMVLDRRPLFIVLKQSQAMISITGDDHNMTLCGPDDEILQLIRIIASAEGLHVWKP